MTRTLSLLTALAVAGCMTDAATDCEPQELATLPTGHHNEGKNCIAGGCHDGSSQAPTWTIAGTLYRSPSGGAPRSGGTIEISDAQGTDIMLVSAQNGNFWSDQRVVFPLTIRASGCSETRRMPNPAPFGSCNQSGCHDTRRIAAP